MIVRLFRPDLAAAAAILVVSLGLKLHGDHAAGKDAVDTALGRAAALLAARGLAAHARPSHHAVTGTGAGGCRFSLRLIDPHASKLATFRFRTASYPHKRFAWRGHFVAQRPVIVPLAEYFVKRELVRQGIPAARNAVWLLADNGRCPMIDASVSKVAVPLR